MEDVFLYSIIFYLGLCVGVGVFHESRGYNLWTGFFLALILSPLIGFIISIASRRKVTRISIEQSSNLRICPFCKEPIQIDATICKHCHQPQEIEIDNTKDTKSIICPNCNTKLLNKIKYCPECGTNVSTFMDNIKNEQNTKHKREIPHKSILITIIIIIMFFLVNAVFKLNLIPEPILDIFRNY